MNAEELAQLIEELETRVERLRAVYDQYFMGIERLEPLVMRKDVDRRLWVLRREQIRNTGMRFKLQTTIQRYNTYQQYWARIVREIENGTYQRDLGRAAARFGENAVTAFGKRRQRMFEKGLAKRAERDAARRGTISSSPPADAEDQEASSESFDVAFEDSEIFNEALAAPNVPSLPLELDMQPDSSPAVAPGAARSPASPDARAPLSTPPQGSPAMVPPRNAKTPRHGSFPPPPLQQAPKARPPAPPPARGQVAKAPAGGSPARPPAGALPPVQPPPARPPAAQRSAEAQQSAEAKGQAGPSRRATPPAGTQLPAPDSGGSGRLASGGSADGELSPARLRQIYGQYVEAKRRANESTAAITYDKIAANLRETAKQLKTKHKGRNVDFEVVMKNGKPVLKPIVKG